MRPLVSHVMLLMKFELLKTIILTGCKAITLLNPNSEPKKQHSIWPTGTGAIMGPQMLMHVINFHFMDEVALLQLRNIFIPTMTAKVIPDKSMTKQQPVIPPPRFLSAPSVPLVAERGTAELVITSRPTELIENWTVPNLILSKSRC